MSLAHGGEDEDDATRVINEIATGRELHTHAKNHSRRASHSNFLVGFIVALITAIMGTVTIMGGDFRQLYTVWRPHCRDVFFCSEVPVNNWAAQ